jgi:hypothetical protein
MTVTLARGENDRLLLLAYAPAPPPITAPAPNEQPAAPPAPPPITATELFELFQLLGTVKVLCPVAVINPWHLLPTTLNAMLLPVPQDMARAFCGTANSAALAHSASKTSNGIFLFRKISMC